MLLVHALFVLQAAPQPVEGLPLPLQKPVAERVELPEGPCREAWDASGGRFAAGRPAARVELELGSAPADVPCSTLDLTPGTWERAETWCAWEGLVRRVAVGAQLTGGAASAASSGRAASAESTASAEGDRSLLARLALLQGRFDDAWSHFAHTQPERLASLMPSFLPGVAASAAFDEAALEQRDPLPDGVLLTPAPPPATAGVPAGFMDAREAWVRGLKIGAAVLDLRIALEPEGVQVDLVHVAGGAARVLVRLPEPEGLELRVAYVDWLRQDEVGLPLEVVVRPGDETHSLYGRVLGRAPAWPTGAAERVPASIATGGLWLVVDEHDPERARLDGVCRALGAYACRVTTGLPTDGVAVHVPPPGPERERKLAWLASATESLALGARATDAGASVGAGVGSGDGDGDGGR